MSDKRTISITVDGNILDLAKKKLDNISGACNTFLTNLVTETGALKSPEIQEALNTVCSEINLLLEKKSILQLQLEEALRFEEDNKQTILKEEELKTYICLSCKKPAPFNVPRCPGCNFPNPNIKKEDRSLFDDNRENLRKMMIDKRLFEE